jgi:hypothetical protein
LRENPVPLEPTTPDPRPQTPDASPGDWFTPRRFAAFLLLAFVVAFPGIWMGTETFFRSDYGVMAYPAAHYLRESLRAGELPLWNPLSNCGAPFLAQWGTMCLYPGSLFFVGLPMPWALGVFCLLHLWLGGLGARALAERWTGNRFAAAVAGTAFAINGASLACITWPNYCVALGWLPWIVLLTEQAWREGGRKLVLAALAGTMQMLTGVPELVILTWGLLAVMLLGEVFEEGKRQKAKGKSAEASAARPTFSFFHFPFSFAAAPLRFGAIIALVAALSAAQLLPFFDLLAHSQRDASYRDARWPMPPWGWANFLVPLFRYFQTPQGFWVQQDQQFLSSYYLGLGVVALALVAVWKARERRVWLLTGVTLFALVMALGDAGFLYTALKHLLPGGGIARFPVKFVLLAAFTVPMLAAFGVAWLVSGSRRREEADNPPGTVSPPPQVGSYDAGQSSTLFTIALALVAGVAVIIWLGQQHALQYDRWPETRANALARLVWLAAALGTIAVAAGFGGRSARERLFARGALLVLLTADPLTHQANQTPRILAAYLSAEFNIGSEWKLEPRPVSYTHIWRNLISADVEEGLLRSDIPDWHVDFARKRRYHWSHLNLIEHVSKVNGSSNLRLREQDEVQRQLYPSNPALAPSAKGLKDFLGVVRVADGNADTGWLVRKAEFRQFGRSDADGPGLAPLDIGVEPRFFPARDSLSRLIDPRFDPGKEVLLPPEASSAIAATAAPNSRILQRLVNAHELVLEVETDAPTLVTVAQSFYHPWKAFVDGQPVKLWRANYAFQAVEVPAGKHTVRLVYVDEKFRLGVGISLAGLAVCGLLWLRGGGIPVGDDARRLTSFPEKVRDS